MPNSRKLAQTWPFPRRSHIVEQMKQTSETWFVSNNCKLHSKYNYCLANWNDWPRNIILPEVTKYIEHIRQEREEAGNGFALHEYIHHGLSSQALLFNLIGPLITRKDLEALRKTLSSQGLIWPAVNAEAELEYEDRKIFNEDSGQPTSIDVVVGNPDNPGALFIECKFTENGFGGCSVFENGDCDGGNPTSNLSMCYLHYIGRRYWELLQQYGFLSGALTTDSSCVLVNHYQFFSNIRCSERRQCKRYLYSAGW
jgi:hypothetical protein